MPGSNFPAVDGDRLWRSLMDLATIGATPKGGVCRLALTDEDRRAREMFVEWARAAGCSIRVDPIGNIFARRGGRDPDRPVVMTGSHIDTQPRGGKFDGNYGVLAGLEVLRRLNDLGIETEAPVEVVVWTNEEGSRFVPVMMGSAVFAGTVALDDARAARDGDGISVGEALDRIGFAGPSCDRPAIDSYFETHIEQGPVLEDAGQTIGIVTGALGQRWFDCEVTGFEAHAGPTPMELRRDALQAAAVLIRRVVEIALVHAPHARGTVGQVQVHPNSRNVIPGGAIFSVDFRAPDDAMLDAMEQAFRKAMSAVASDHKVGVALRETSRFAALRFDAGCIAEVATAARDLGADAMEIVSGAGHDAIHIATCAPSAMIFVPCAGGVSHNELEDADPADLAAGANILLRCILNRARVVEHG
ncbi:MAG: Zn-dependent hydrolase [Sphingobium sp.]